MFIVVYIYLHTFTREIRGAHNVTNEVKILIMCYSAYLIQANYKERHKTRYCLH